MATLTGSSNDWALKVDIMSTVSDENSTKTCNMLTRNTDCEREAELTSCPPLTTNVVGVSEENGSSDVSNLNSFESNKNNNLSFIPNRGHCRTLSSQSCHYSEYFAKNNELFPSFNSFDESGGESGSLSPPTLTRSHSSLELRVHQHDLDFVNIPLDYSSNQKGIEGENQQKVQKEELFSPDDAIVVSDSDNESEWIAKRDCASEVEHVLENFNSILERIEQEERNEGIGSEPCFPKNSSTSTPATYSPPAMIKNSIENIADLLLLCGNGENHDDEDLLLALEENEACSCQNDEEEEDLKEDNGVVRMEVSDEDVQEEEGAWSSDEVMDKFCEVNGNAVDLKVMDDEDDEDEDDDVELEGYESDRPMVCRASMRKLKPVHIMPACTSAKLPAISPVHETNYVNINATNTNNYNELSGGRDSSPTPIVPSGSAIQANHEVLLSNVNQILVTTLLGQPPSRSRSGSPALNSSSERPSNSTVVGFNDQGSNVNSGETADESFSSSIHFDENPSSDHQPLDRSSQTRENVQQDSISISIPEETDPMTRDRHLLEEGCLGSGSAMTMNSSSRENNSAECGTTSQSENTQGTTPRRRRRMGSRHSRLRDHTERWPHRLNSIAGLLSCTIGLYNICRFSHLSIEHGANFVIQFFFLSFVFGFSLLTFHMSVGQYLSAGVMDMWKISPIFQGIGVGILMSQAMIGIYTTVGLSWMFIYFRDSFITRNEKYRWSTCLNEYRACNALAGNGSLIYDAVPDYFHGVVLERSIPDYPKAAYIPSNLKFNVIFNLAIAWIFVFICLSRGLKSYGKVIHGLVSVAMVTFFVLSFKMFSLVSLSDIIGSFDGSNFFSSQTWMAAAREVFMTWGLLGACMMQVTSHNKPSQSLKTDSIIVIVLTSLVLLFSAFLGNTCYSILSRDFVRVQSSFEHMQSFAFVLPLPSSLPANTLIVHHETSLIMGNRGPIPENLDERTTSGYQVLRLATEWFPLTTAYLGPSRLLPFWTVLFYLGLLLFGLSQQMVIWHCVIRGVMTLKPKLFGSWETTLTFVLCGTGFVLAVPFCTESGIFITYFIDFVIGNAWWIMSLYLLELIIVFLVRGTAYCAENIATMLFNGNGEFSKTMVPLTSFLWNLVTPVALLILTIASFETGLVQELYDWSPSQHYIFWPRWTREIGSMVQIIPIVAIPFVAIIQSCRYLSNDSSDILERMQQLYRPNLAEPNDGAVPRRNDGTERRTRSRSNSETDNHDQPPKYTPPPSYSTATGAKIARFLRNSIRRSVRRISSPPESRAPPPPPNYASVIVEIQNSQTISGGSEEPSCSGGQPQLVPPPDYESSMAASKSRRPSIYHTQLSKTLGRSLAHASGKDRASLRRISSDISPRDIARVLRASCIPKDENPSPLNQEASSVPSSERLSLVIQHQEDKQLCSAAQNVGKSFEYPLLSSMLMEMNTQRSRRSQDSQLALILNEEIQPCSSVRASISAGSDEASLSTPPSHVEEGGGTSNPTFTLHDLDYSVPSRDSEA